MDMHVLQEYHAAVLKVSCLKYKSASGNGEKLTIMDGITKDMAMATSKLEVMGRDKI